jgi:hypothetical protein
MAITVEWDDADKTILRNDYTGAWTWDEYIEAGRQNNELVASVPHRVDIIANMREGTMPRGGSAIAISTRVIRSAPPNRGIIVVVINPLLKALVSVFKKLDNDIGSITFAAESLDEARRVVARERERVG